MVGFTTRTKAPLTVFTTVSLTEFRINGRYQKFSLRESKKLVLGTGKKPAHDQDEQREALSA
jgi:hypothetical protein